jgi:O-antigen ligase
VKAIAAIDRARLMTLLAAALVLAPVLVCHGHADVRVGLAPVYAQKLVLAAAVAMVLCLLAASAPQSQSVPRWIIVAAAVLVFAYALGAAASPHPAVALPTAFGRIALVACFVALAHTAAPTAGAVGNIVILVGALLAAMVVFEILGVRWATAVETVPAVTLVNRNNVAFHLAAALPCVVASLFAARGRRPVAFALALLALVGYALVASRSRGAWLAALAGVAFVLTLGRHVTRRWLVVSAGLLALAGAACTHRRDLEPLSTRVETLFDRDSDAVRDRVHLYRTTLSELAVRPLLGWGAGVFPVVHPRFFSDFAAADHPHDDLLTAAWEAGVPAGLALAVLLLGITGGVARSAWREQSIERAGLAGSLITWLVLGAANSSTALAPSAAQLWLTLAVAARVVGPARRPS